MGEDILNNPQAMGLFIACILGIILFIINIYNAVTIRKLKIRYEKFFRAGFNEKNLEQLIDACIFKSEDANDKYKEVQSQVNKIEANMLKCVQKIGFVRYSAFENVGSDQSFSIALLDVLDGGVVISGIHSRETSAVYSKLIEGGKSKYTLTAEEIQAIDRARRNYGERMYKDNKTGWAFRIH